MKVGDLVRLVQTRGHVKKAEAGRLMTVRALLGRDPDFAVRVDDGDPADPDTETNGFRISLWLPLSAVEPLSRGWRRNRTHDAG